MELVIYSCFDSLLESVQAIGHSLASTMSPSSSSSSPLSWYDAASALGAAGGAWSAPAKPAGSASQVTMNLNQRGGSLAARSMSLGPPSEQLHHWEPCTSMGSQLNADYLVPFNVTANFNTNQSTVDVNNNNPWPSSDGANLSSLLQMQMRLQLQSAGQMQMQPSMSMYIDMSESRYWFFAFITLVGFIISLISNAIILYLFTTYVRNPQWLPLSCTRN